MKFLVIGATGCIGRAMVDFLIEKNADFRAVVHRTPLEKKVETVYADITRPEDIEKCVRDVDVIFHLAFPMSHLTYSLPYKELESLQCVATENIAKAACEAGVKRIVFMSSVSVYGKPRYFPIDENHPLQPSNNYALTKADAERILLNYADKIEVVLLRAAPVYGPGSQIFYKLLKMCKDGSMGVIGDGDKRTHLLYSRNCAQATYLAGTVKNINRQIFNVADESPRTFNEIYSLIAEHLGIEKLRRLPYWKAYLYAAFSDFVSALTGHPAHFSRALLETLTRERIYSIEKAKKILGYKPAYTMEDGFAEMIEEFLKSEK